MSEQQTTDKGNGTADTEQVEATQTEISVEHAMNVLKQQVEQRKADCKQKIDQVLEEHGCVLSVAMIVTPQGNQPILRVDAKQGG